MAFPPSLAIFLALLISCSGGFDANADEKTVVRSPELRAKANKLGDWFGSGHVQYLQPEQVHLSYWGNPKEMWVTWVTQGNATEDNIPVQSFVEYGTNGFVQKQEGTFTHFVDQGTEKRWIFVHRVKMTDLIPNTRYMYHVGGHRTGWSDPLFFRSLPTGSSWSPRFAVYGDLGNEYGYSIGPLQSEAAMGHFDAILHVGDLAYDMAQDNARFGDEFMRQMQPVAGLVPYMTCPGNHENHYNFLNYKSRFTMPGNGRNDEPNMFYSVNIGPAHIVAVTTEFFYFTNYGWKQIADQYAWLEKDLAEAARPENLAKQPWIILMGHRPPYCNVNDDPEMCVQANMVRVGLPGIEAYGFEPLLYKYGVDLAFWAHEHAYERTYPVYDNIVMNGTNTDAYENPGATVHIINGAAGNREKNDGFKTDLPAYSAFRNSDFGYGRMIIFNETHLYFEQVSAEKGVVIDRMMIKKTLHGPKAFQQWREKNKPV